MRNSYSCSWSRATNNSKLAVGKGFKSHTTLECVSPPIPGGLSNRLGLVTSLHFRSSLVAQMVKSLDAMQETCVQSLGWEDPLEEGMVTHSSILAWEIPRTEETGRLPSMGSQRVKHDWVTNTWVTNSDAESVVTEWVSVEASICQKGLCWEK